MSRKKKNIAIFSDSISKNLRMEEFDSFVKEGKVKRSLEPKRTS